MQFANLLICWEKRVRKGFGPQHGHGHDALTAHKTRLTLQEIQQISKFTAKSLILKGNEFAGHFAIQQIHRRFCKITWGTTIYRLRAARSDPPR